FALLPISRGAREQQMLRGLADLMEADHGVKCVTAELVDAALGPGASERDDARTTEWLSRIERDTSALLYECDLERPAWMARSVRQSDRLVIIARPGHEHRLGDVITEIKKAHRGGVVRRIELVVVHPRNTALPSGTNEWARLPEIRCIHHVREH